MTTTIDRPMSMRRATEIYEDHARSELPPGERERLYEHVRLPGDPKRIALMVTRSLGRAVLDSVLANTKAKLIVISEVGDRKIESWCADQQVRRVVYMKEHASYVTHCVRSFGADAILAAHWNQYVPKPLREATELGVLAYHPSVLPKYRGNDSVRDQAAANEPYPGGTVYQMDDGLDTGPILMQRSGAFTSPYEAGAIWKEWLFPLGVSLLTEVAQRIDRGEALSFVNQDDQR